MAIKRDRFRGCSITNILQPGWVGAPALLELYQRDNLLQLLNTVPVSEPPLRRLQGPVGGNRRTPAALKRAIPGVTLTERQQSLLEHSLSGQGVRVYDAVELALQFLPLALQL